MSRLKNVRTRHDDALSRIDRDEFERVLAAHYRDVGWWVEHVGTGGTGATLDGGVDLRLRRDAQVVLVQCRHWSAKQVSHEAVHDLLGLLAAEGATGAILITSGTFTDAAIAAAGRTDKLRLIDGRGVHDMLGDDAFASPGPEPQAAPRRTPPRPGTGLRLLMPLVALLCAIGFVLVVREMLARTASTAGELPAAGTRVATVVVVPPPAIAPAPVPVPPTVDAPPPPPTAAEIRASQRRADEAMRTIEDTTPEM
jgi:hypothetical protein